jgi:hypothetical protein
MSRSYTPLPPSASMACRGTAFIYIPMYVCMCMQDMLFVCMHVCSYVYVRTCVYAYVNICTQFLCDIYACVRTRVCMCIYIYVCMYEYVCRFLDVTTLSDSLSPFFSPHPQSCLLSPFCRFILDSLYRLCSTVSASGWHPLHHLLQI